MTDETTLENTAEAPAELITENLANTTEIVSETNNQEDSVEQAASLDVPDFDTKKWLYAFTAKNKNGEKKRFFILKPNRILKQDGEIEYAKQLARYVKAGLLPKAAWKTILENLGGTISNPEAEDYASNRTKYFEYSIELNRINQKSEKTPEDVEESVRLKNEISQLETKIQSFELEQIYIFENTAEAKARNATVLWWLLNLSYDENGNKFFKGKNFDEQIDWYDGLDSKENEFDLQIAQRLNFLITLWFLNRVSDWKDFKNNDSF